MSMFAFLKRNPVATLLLAAALAALLWFSTGFVREALYFSDPAHQKQDLATWMSPRYVGKSWDLPREVIIETMDLQPDNAQKTLKDVLDHLGITLEELQTRIEEAKVRDGGGEDGSVAGGEKARRKKVEAGRRGDEAGEEGGGEEEQAHRRRGDQRARAPLRRPTRKCQ